MSLFTTTYDVIVVGGGHAGSEAAAAAANMGAHTLLITMNLQNIAQMSCNPAMGGIAKGQIIREIDALGGFSGIVTDKTAIQFKMLNTSKGPAMWSPRAQSDRMQFAECWRTVLEQTNNLDFYQDAVNGLMFEDPDASRRTEFFVRWSHSQDPKARPNGRFNANVNFGSSGNFRSQLNSSQEDFLSNTFSSSINYNASLPGKPVQCKLS